MGEPSAIQGSSARELTPRGSLPSMFSCPPVRSYLPEDSAISRNLRLRIPQVPPLHPDFNLSSYAPMETAIQIPQEPTSNSSLQMSQNPLMYPGIPMQSRLQNHLSSVSQLNYEMYQSPPFPPETPMQSSLQWYSYPERSLGPQVSSGPSMLPSIQMQTDLPTLETVSVCPSDQVLSRSSVSSGCGGSLGLRVPSDNYGDQKVRPKATKIQRKERTVYSEEQKLVLQKYFDQHRNPSPEQCEALAQKINVTKCEIQTWFKNKRAKDKRRVSKKIEKGLLESSGSSKDVSGFTHSHCPLSVLASDKVESKSPGTSTVASISKVNPSLEASLHDDQDIEDAGCIPQEDSLEAAALDPGQPTVVEVQPEPSVAEEPASVEAPVPTTAAAQGPDDAQYIYPSSDQLWQWMLEYLDTWEDS